MGLGTSIVQALAGQLSATVETEKAHPGTRVAIVHNQIALVSDQSPTVADAPAIERPAA